MDLRESAPTRSNSGTFRAENGGKLNIHDSGVITNTTGTIEALDASNVIIGNTTIQGGILDTSGTGVIDLVGYNTAAGTLADLTNNGTVRVANGEDGILSGTIINNGEIKINATGAAYTDLQISGEVTLAGDGTVTMGPQSNYSRFRAVSADASQRLTNSANHTIQGNGQLGVDYFGMVNEGLILANGGGTLSVNPRATAGGLTNNGTLQVDAGSTMIITDSLNNYAAGTLTGGTYKVYGTDTDPGTMRLPSGSNITTNAATILLDGPNSNIYNANTGTTSALSGLAANTSAGSFTIENGRNFTTAGAFSNAGMVQVGFTEGDTSTFTTTDAFDNTGTLQMRGGTFAAGAGGSLTNQAEGVINGYGTVTTTVLNHGLVEAAGGNLIATIDGQSGTVQIDSSASLTLSGNSDASYLVHNGSTAGSLALGSYNFTVDEDYTNANFGSGNSFDGRANVTGSGQIIGTNAAQAITGDVMGGTTTAVTLDLGNVRGETSRTLNYQIANTGTGADIRGAVQNAANGGSITDSRLSGTGVTAANFGPIAAGNDSGDLGIIFNATSGGALTGQTVAVVSNFDNVATQVITIDGFASALAVGNASPSGPVGLGNFHVGAGSDPSQSFAVTNTTTGAGAEQLGIVSATSSGNFGTTNNLGSGLIAGGATSNNALTLQVSGGVAGVNNGNLAIQYLTNGTNIDGSFTDQNTNLQNVSVQATGYNLASGSTSPSPVTIVNQRVGGTESQALTVSNTASAGAYTEGLNASFGGNSGGAANNGGNISLLAGGGSNNSSMTVGVNTATAGAKTGTVSLNYISDGTGSSGLGTTDVGSQTIGVSGSVYQVAQPTLLTASVNLGNVHVGESLDQAITITNTNVAPGYQEGLDANVNSGANASGSGTITNLEAGSSSTAISVGMTAAAAGVNTGSVVLGLASNGTGTSELTTLALADQSVGTQITGYRLAGAQINNAGAFSFGNVHVGDTVEQSLSITNTAVADNYSERLDAGFGGTSDGRITTSGGLSLLGAGETNSTSMVIGVNTAASGIVNGTATVNFVSNGAGTSDLGITGLGSQDVAVSASISGNVYNYAEATINTAQPIDYGNVRIGTSVTPTTLSITNSAPDDGFSESLNAAAGTTTGGATASGAFNLLAAGQTNTSNIAVGLDTSVVGNRSGQATIDFVSDGAGTSDLGQTSLPSQTVQVVGNVYRLADPTVNTSSITMAARLGDASPAASVSISNSSADVYTEGLNASIGTTSSGFTANGDISNLAAGQTDASSLQVGLGTTTAGTFTGSATLALVSTGEGTTGESDLVLADQSVTLSGKVYAPAVAQVADTIIDFGIVHVGDTGSAMALDVINAAALTDLNDVLTGSFSGATGAFTASGNLGSGLEAGASDNSRLTASLNTSAAGYFNGTATASFQSHNADLADLGLGDEVIDLIAQVNNYAKPVFNWVSGSGTLTQSGPEYYLDFGDILLNSGTLTATLNLMNDITGPADLLGGAFNLTGTYDFGLTGFDSFVDIMAGQSLDGLLVDFDPSSLGLFSGSFTLNAIGYNEGGYRDPFDAIVFNISGNVVGDQAPVPEPASFVLLAAGLIGLVATRKRFKK